MAVPDATPRAVVRAPTTYATIRILAALTWRRTVNRFAVGAAKRGAADGTRQANPRRGARSGLLFAFLACFVLLQTVTSSARLVARLVYYAEMSETAPRVFVSEFTRQLIEEEMAEQTGVLPLAEASQSLRVAVDYEVSQAVSEAAQPVRRRAIEDAWLRRDVGAFEITMTDVELPWPSVQLWFPSRPQVIILPLLLVSTLVGLVALLQCLAAAGRDLTDVGARAEWLFGFPVPARALFLAQALAVALNPIFVAVVWPFFSVIYWCAGFGFWGVFAGALAALYLGGLCGAARITAETTLRHYVSQVNVSRVQALLYLFGSVAMMLTIALIYSPEVTRIVSFAGRASVWLGFNPLALPLGAVQHGTSLTLTALTACAVLFVALGAAAWWSERMVRDGVIVSSTVFVGSRSPLSEATWARAWPNSMIHKEWWAMLRERQVRTQAFVAPGLLLLTQYLVNPHLLSGVTANPRALAATAFAISAFVLIGATTALANESPTLWLLASFPHRLEQLLLRKAVSWCTLASGYACVTFAVFSLSRPGLWLQSLPYLPLVLVAIVLFSIISLGLGILGTDPQELEANRRVGMGTIYQHLMLITLFGVGIYWDGAWSKVTQSVLSALLAYALWQKAKDRIPYLLDPSARPPAQLSVVDGMLAALAFFGLQALLVAVLGQFDIPLQRALLIAFGTAGSIVTAVSLWLLRRAGIVDLWSVLGLRWPAHPGHALKALLLGVSVGAAAVALAMGYITSVTRIPVLQRFFDAGDAAAEFDVGEPGVLLMLVAIAAPLVEEFIFRGMLYGGLRRSLNPVRAALVSALVFALVHPAVAAAPVFLLALGASFTYERTRWLGAPIAAHMTYNAVLALGSVWAGNGGG